MDIEPPQQNTPLQNIPSVQKLNPHRRVHSLLAISIVAVVAAGVGYLSWAWSHQYWPFYSQDARSHFFDSDTNSWKTYRNEEYNFEIKYPQDYPLRMSPLANQDSENWVEGYIPFGKATGDIGIKAVILMPSPKMLYPNTDLDQAFVAVQTINPVVECGEAAGNEFKGAENINGKDFLKFASGSGAAGHQATRNSYYYARSDGVCYIVSEIIYTSGFGAVDGLEQVNKAAVFGKLHRIVSTFKLIESAVDTSYWKTYRNEEYGYEFKYPHDWRFWKQIAAGEFSISYDDFSHSGKVVLGSGQPGLSDSPGITIEARDQEALKDTLYSGSKTLDEFLSKQPLQEGRIFIEVAAEKTLKQNFDNFTILTFFHKEVLYGLSLPTDLFDQILSTFKFIEPAVDNSKLMNTFKFVSN